jgi:hypothetical protein
VEFTFSFKVKEFQENLVDKGVKKV